jgi:predicted O-methyltransferase YrrM
MLLLERIILYLKHRALARHRKGRNVHPPFAYGFVRHALFGEDVGGLEVIEDLRRELLKSREILKVSDPGAGSAHLHSESRPVGKLVKHTAVSRKKGRLLARIVSRLGPDLIIELGTGAGISSLYMGLACPFSKVLSCEGSPAIASLARSVIEQAGAGNIELACDNFMDWLPGKLNLSASELSVFIDGDHRGERLLKYYRMIAESGYKRAVLILDDIHWSADMYRAWKVVMNDRAVTLSLEGFNLGIVFLGYDLQKVHFIVNF